MNKRLKKKRNKQRANKIRNTQFDFLYANPNISEFSRMLYFTTFRDILSHSCKAEYLYKRNVMRAFKSFCKKWYSTKVPSYTCPRFAHGFQPGKVAEINKPTRPIIVAYEPHSVKKYQPVVKDENNQEEVNNEQDVGKQRNHNT